MTRWETLEQSRVRLTRRGERVVTAVQTVAGLLLLLACLLLAKHGIENGTPGPLDGCSVDARGYCVEETTHE